MAEENFYDKAVVEMDDMYKAMIVRESLINKSKSLVGALGGMNMMVVSGHRSDMVNSLDAYIERKAEMTLWKIWRPEYDEAFKLANEGKFGDKKQLELWKLVLEGEI